LQDVTSGNLLTLYIENRDRGTSVIWKNMLATALALQLLPHAGAAAGAGYESHERIRGLAEAFALERGRSSAPSGAEIKAEAARLDPRLALPACASLPETFDPPGRSTGSQAVVGVRCAAGAAWSIYVPVRLEIVVPVVVLAAPAARGEALDAAALRLEPRNVAGLTSGYLTAQAEAEGKVLRRAVAPGTILNAALLERPTLIRRGERVRLRVGTASFSVGSEGEALADAAEGEHLRVRNTRSGRVVEGVVDGEGNVVALW
jgi:flagella basal body P-ring formation protein FlgA